MAEVRHEKVKLDILYNFIKGTNKINKKIINQNYGEYPVYSGSETNDGLMGCINSYDFDGEYVRIITVGKVGQTSIIKGKFSLAQNNGVLISKDENKTKFILTKYLEIVLLKQLQNKAKGTDTGNKQQSLTKKQILDTIINIPINKNGIYDIETQKEIVKKYEIVEEKKKELKEKLDYFKDVQIDFMVTEMSKHKEYKISDIFNIFLGDGKYTKSYSIKNIGKFPLYSGQIEGEYANINSYDYSGSYLTWAKDGLAGYIMHHDNEKFSITNHRGILVLKDEYNSLSLEFLKILLEPIFRKNIKGRLGTQEKNEYTTLSKEMMLNIKDKLIIPINNDGTFDIEKQKEIVRKYKVIEEMKKSILEKSLPFTLSNVQFDGETPYIYIYKG